MDEETNWDKSPLLRSSDESGMDSYELSAEKSHTPPAGASHPWHSSYAAVPSLTRRSRATPLLARLLLGLAFLASLALAVFLGFRLQPFKYCYPTQQCRAHTVKSSSIDASAFRNINGTIGAKPPGVKIVAAVFFGRRQYVDILDCYLRRNLAVNGGLIDEVHFVMNAALPEDREWLDHLVADADVDDRYRIFETENEGNKWHGFRDLWGEFMTDPDTIYVKIDDDILYIDDAAIPRMLNTLLANPEAHNVQANVINNIGTYWFHYRTGAIQPYLPDESAPSGCNTTWRVSELPCYAGRPSTSWMDFYTDYEPPFDNHRWLPLNNTVANLMRTPMAAPLPSPDGFHLPRYWTTEAQAHFSFLHNLEQGQLSRYDFGNDQGVWNNWYHHYNVNFMVIRGSTVALAPFWGEDMVLDRTDEMALTVDAPRMLERPVLVDTRAVVSHYGFHHYWGQGLYKTDVLSRYRAYANEMVCGPRNQKVAFSDI